MSYEIRQFTTIDNKNIKLGKTFKYGNDYNLTNIYYIASPTPIPTPTPTPTPTILPDGNKSNVVISSSATHVPKELDNKRQDSPDDKTKLIIQTPLMYIPNSIVYFNEKPFLELSFNNEEHDSDVATFKEWVTALENYIFKLVKRRTSLKLDKSNMISVLKSGFRNSSCKLLIPINLNISKCVLSDDGKKTKFLFNWEIPVPTYGISIIWVKNVWIKGGKWGVNLFMYASRVMNSHILDPIEFLGGVGGDNKSIKTIDVVKQFAQCEKMSITVGAVPEFNTYFRMLRMGIPINAVKQKLLLTGIDVRIIDYPESTPYATVLHYLANPNLPPYINASAHTNAHTNAHANAHTNTHSNATNIPPPPPLAFLFPNNTPNNTPNTALTSIGRSNLLNSITSGGFTLKKAGTQDDSTNATGAMATDTNKQKMLDKLANRNSQLLVPSLSAIQSALAKLKKVDMDDIIVAI